MLLLTIFAGFVIGALTILAVELLGVLYILRRLTQRPEDRDVNAPSPASSAEIFRDNYDFSYPYKQGSIWVLETEKVPKNWLTDKRQREQKRNKGTVEVTPVRKYAKLKDQLLILTESDNSSTEVLIKGCTIEAVSSTSLSSRKWAKRFPIKVESRKSAIYHGSRTLYIYLGTSWEKESWCKALRVASNYDNDKQKLKWFAKLRSEFQSYLTSLNTDHPSLLKPYSSYSEEAIDKLVKSENPSSKVRHFLKKLAKKASKSGFENTLNADREERKISAKSTSFKDSISTSGSVKLGSSGKSLNYSDEEDMVTSSLSGSTGSGLYSSDDKNFGDEGTLCFNLLMSRLFFDAKSNTQIKNSIQTRIQRTLNNMRIPSYIGEITCTGVSTGNLPPHIRGMRVLPSDMNEAMALELDIEYSGGAMLDITTRIEVRELDLPGVDNTSSELSSMNGVTSDLLEGFEYFQKDLKLSERIVTEAELKDEGNGKVDDMKTGKSTTQGSSSVSKWKTIVNSVAKQVSQVPLSLGIKVGSLRGTLQLHIKSPPSDQLWIGFTHTPEIDFILESSFGEHKISNGQIAGFLINRIKAAIKDTMVLPNCECVGIPWMLAEKDDWVPREVAPFIWISKEPAIDSTGTSEVPPRVQPGEVASHVKETSKVNGSNHAEGKHNKAKTVEFVDRPNNEFEESSSGPTNRLTSNGKALQELTTPLLESDEQEEENPEESQSTSRSIVLGDEQNNHNTEGEISRSRRIGTRARMRGLGKKMGEKLEEKRRHLEEKGKIIVERMREKPENI